MNDCGNAILRDRLPDLLHERLGGRERAELETHLAVCADCRAELELLREAAAALTVGGPVDTPAIARALPAGIRARSRRRVWRRVAAAAASIVIVAAGSFALLDRGPEPASRIGAADAGDSLVPAPDASPPAVVAATPSGIAPAASAASLPVGASLGELSDSQLAALLASLESLDALPSIEPSPVVPIVPLNGEG